MPLADAITEVFRFLNNHFASPKKQISKVVKIYDAMNKVLEETNIERFLVFKVHNGGGVINPTGDLYVSVLYEDYRLPFSSVKTDYQKLPLDNSYAKMLVDIIKEKKVHYNITNMPEGLLRQIYSKDKVESSIIYFLGQDRKNVYFCSCASSHSNIYDELIVDLGVNTIKQNIK